MTTTLAPASLSWIAAWIPALPPPITTRSTSKITCDGADVDAGFTDTVEEVSGFAGHFDEDVSSLSAK